MYMCMKAGQYNGTGLEDIQNKEHCIGRMVANYRKVWGKPVR